MTTAQETTKPRSAKNRGNAEHFSTTGTEEIQGQITGSVGALATCHPEYVLDGICGLCEPEASMHRVIEQGEADERRAQEQAVEEYLANRRGIYAPSMDALCEFLRVLDDPADTDTVLDTADTDVDLDEGETLVETASDRLLNYADAEGLLLVGEYPLDVELRDTPSDEWTDEQRAQFEAHLDQDPRYVLFVVIDETTAELFTREQRAAHPDVRVFPACPGLPLRELSARFHSAGLDIDWFEPSTLVPWEISADTVEWLTNGPEGDDDADDIEDDGDATDEGDDEPARNAPLDLRRLRTEPRKPVEYLEPGIFPRGRYMGLSGEAGAGKSVLMRDMAVHWSLGRSALDPNHRFEPARVVYLDAENGPDWWHEGLDKMDAPLDLPNLRVIPFPELGEGLDTRSGSRSFLELIESLGEVDVLILDTVSRFISGGENDSDTWHSFYRYAMLPLRRAGIGVLRLDHVGKNLDLGARGSSAKMSDLDAHYMLTAPARGSNDLTLKLDKRRQADYVETVKLTRQDGPLGHLRMPEGKLTFRTGKSGREIPEDPKVAALVAELDRLHIAAGLSRRVQQAELKKKGSTVKGGSDAWNEAVKFRKERIDREAEHE